jgi:hypothetical protein
VLLSTPLHASPSPHLLNVLVQIANKLGLQKKKKKKKYSGGSQTQKYPRQSLYIQLIR